MAAVGHRWEVRTRVNAFRCDNPEAAWIADVEEELAAQDRAAEVALRGEEHIAALERAANDDGGSSRLCNCAALTEGGPHRDYCPLYGEETTE